MIVEQVASGIIPRDTAIATLKASFPTLDDNEIGDILDPLKKWVPKQIEPKQPKGDNPKE